MAFSEEGQSMAFSEEGQSMAFSEEGQSIWSKCRQGFQPCFEAGIRELPFLMPEPAENPSLHIISTPDTVLSLLYIRLPPVEEALLILIN